MKSVHTCASGLSLLLALLFTAGTSAGDSGSKVYIKEVDVFLVLPEDYSLGRNNEDNGRSSSFVSYDFLSGYDPSVPSLKGIQFFSRESIKRFEDYCAKCKTGGGENSCEIGYIKTAEYDRQREALKNPRKYKTKYQVKRFGNRNFIVYDIPGSSTGDFGFYREYRTFINDIMVAVWIHRENESQAKAADRLFANLKILKQ